MQANILPQVAALIAMLPLTAAALTARLGRNLMMWSLLVAAVLGPTALVVGRIQAGWQPGLSANLWVSISATLLAYAVLSLVRPGAFRLGALLLPYLALSAALAIAFSGAQDVQAGAQTAGAWFPAHVFMAVASYATLTLAAIAGLAVILQERVLKRRAQPGWTSRALPPLAESEGLQIRLLRWSFGLMAAALATGTAAELMETGQLVAFTHKILLAFLAFAMIGILLILHHRTGLRGRLAARWLLAGYLLLLLAYPGVKFIHDVLMG